MELFKTYYIFAARLVSAALAVGVFICLKRQFFKPVEHIHVLGVLDIENGSLRLPITHFETSIGRGKSCDVIIPVQTVSRQHAVLTLLENGYWQIADTQSKGGIYVNGVPLAPDTLIDFGDRIELGGVHLSLKTANILDAEQVEQTKEKAGNSLKQRLLRLLTGGGKSAGPATTLLLLNAFQLLAATSLILTLPKDMHSQVLGSFAYFGALMWAYLPLAKKMGIENHASQLTAFFLTTLGLCTTASAAPHSLYKQVAAVTLGLGLFFTLCFVLKRLTLTMALRKMAAAASVALLLLNILIGTRINGQLNWIVLGPVTIQPSEFVKILFIFTSCATLQWLMTTKNVTRLAAYSLACIGFLVIMGDFGTALIFFFTYLVLTFMTSGDIRAVIFSVGGAAMGGIMVLKFKPYVVDRFGAWRKVWQFAYEQGFQQTRALMAIASGGLFGLGAGKGFLQHVFAADTDLVFGVIAEEWGLVIALLVLFCYVLFLLAAIGSHKYARSSYYVIAACATASMFLFQACLNVFGTADILPLTGVTLPFVSNGGSSIAASYAMLGFISGALNFTRPKIKKKRLEKARKGA